MNLLAWYLHAKEPSRAAKHLSRTNELTTFSTEDDGVREKLRGKQAATIRMLVKRIG